MWECGLKPACHSSTPKVVRVTPYVGVWIETERIPEEFATRMSLLMWECGLKL